MSWFLEALKKYAVFGGRARRREYWYFALFSSLLAVLAVIFDMASGTLDPQSGLGVVGVVVGLGLLLPGLAVTVRRLHDTGRSGWWYFIALVPIVGGIALLIFMLQDSQPGANQYGANPKETMEGLGAVPA